MCVTVHMTPGTVRSFALVTLLTELLGIDQTLPHFEYKGHLKGSFGRKSFFRIDLFEVKNYIYNVLYE